MPSITIAIPTKQHINASCVLSLLSGVQQLKEYKNIIRILPGKSNIDQARSILLTEWYDVANEDDLFLFIDSDQTFTKDDILNVINLKSDVAVGVYSSSNDRPTCFAIEPTKFFKGESHDLYYGATGFMLIRKPICHRIYEYLKKEHKGDARFWIGTQHTNVIPFFTQRFIDSELNPGTTKEWLGEDYNFCWLCRKVGGSIKGILSPTIGHEVAQVKYYYPKEMTQKTWNNKSIVYFIGTPLKWTPNDLTTGLGGSETAIIYLTQQWVLKGYDVSVYYSGDDNTHNGVQYINYNKFNIHDKFNILILWRSYGFPILQHAKANKLFFDFHDVPNINYQILDKYIEKINLMFVKSEYHKSLFPPPMHSKIMVIQNGINYDYFKNDVKSDVNKLIYVSSYDRGLEYMLKYGFPKIKEAVPQAELHVYYGMDLVQDDAFKTKIYALLKQHGVVNHGKVGQYELGKIRQESGIHYYYGNFTEIDCISVKESAYAGCVPIVSSVGVFGDLDARKYLIKKSGDPTLRGSQENVATLIIKILQDESLLKYYQKQVLDNIKDIESWEKVSDSWISYF